MLRIALALVTALGAFTPATAQMHGGGGMHGHGADGTGHDMATMPGLRGEDATEVESAELATLFRNFTTLSREVELLPNGIRTVTSASDPEVMDALVSHVVGMIDRVGQGRDPKIFIQSPTLDIFFARPGAIASDVEVTDAGIVVTQTSTDPEVVEALHIHAGEVSRMADSGMQAVHEMMMERAGN
ncbi:hypothetical protein [Vannielia litorea]|uniref:DUF302 domain-containing protein n=1 Tax=Vannielia litorea TaxID=1217970 RepID=A0A1N6GNM7_9RHOB|nr:hypothetical protein [Vannielia litorea]SIO09118.1 hypothetical protein SAMN05444002_2645 [Vannielia litorea]